MRRGALLAACCWSVACAQTIAPRPPAQPSQPAREALLVLPGFGYGDDGARALRALAQSMAADGLDLYVPAYVSRAGLDESRTRLERFIRDKRLDRYQRVHVFAFLAGGWTVNPLVDRGLLPNLSTIVYDRSPYQERAPRVAMERLRLLAWLRYGPVLFDIARTPFPPLDSPDVRIGLVVETVPTAFIRRFADSARRQGPYRFECDALGQPFDDCLYVALDHPGLYSRFADVWPEVRAFIQHGRFTAAANRTPPSGEPAAVTVR